MHDGQRIRLKGKGAPGERGGPAGDLYVTVHVTPHPVFGRKGDNLTVTVPVTFAEAALGAEIKVPTLGGPPVTLKLPAGTPNGRTFRVRGKGAPRKDGTRGDLLVTVEVAVPQNLDGKARGGAGGAAATPRRVRTRGPTCSDLREGAVTDGQRVDAATAATTDDVPVYVISVAAQLSGLHPQTLRQYDRLGLVSPGRTPGGGRRYSARDIAALREVQRLSGDGHRASRAYGGSWSSSSRCRRLRDRVADLEAPARRGATLAAEKPGRRRCTSRTARRPRPTSTAPRWSSGGPTAR